MITRERLEELIEKGATIYSTNWKEEVDLSLPCRITEVFHSDGVVREHLIVYEGEGFSPSYLLDGLTEDIEGAKWQEEFGCIERTERLELPTWEEIKVDFIDNKQSAGNYCVKEFFGKEQEYSLDVVVYNGEPMITVFDTEFYCRELTKENYTLACRKCVELFKGEKK